MFRRMVLTTRHPLQRIRNIDNSASLLGGDVAPLLLYREKGLETPGVVEEESDGSAVGVCPVADVGGAG